MRRVSYHPLLRLRLSHDYFGGAGGAGVSLVATDATEARLRAAGGRGVDRPDGLEVFQQRGSATTLTKAFGPDGWLAFWLRPRDPYFGVYTPLAEADDEPVLMLLSGYGEERIDFAEGARTPVQSSTDIYEFRQVPKLTAQTGWDATEAMRLEEQSEVITTVRFPNLPAGGYTLRFGTRKTRFVPATDGYRRGDVGLLTLPINQLPNVEEQGAAHLEYTLHFPARATYWRYNVVDPGQQFGDYRINGSSEWSAAFPGDAPHGERVLPGGKVATTLLSHSPLHLRARPKSTPKLTVRARDGHGPPHSIILPAAEARQLIRPGPDEPVPPGGLISDIFVYL